MLSVLFALLMPALADNPTAPASPPPPATTSPASDDAPPDPDPAAASSTPAPPDTDEAPTGEATSADTARAPSLAELRAVWARQPAEDVLTEVRLRIDVRDFAAADARLDFLIDTTDASMAWFEYGRSLELQERYRDALQAYDGALDRSEDPAFTRDVLYRKVISSNDLRHHAEARTLAPTLRKLDSLDPTALPIVDLELGVAEASLGKRKGNKRITRALAQLDAQGTDQAWARSRARFVLTRQLLEASRDVRIVGNKRAARALVRRAEALKAAEAQVIAIAKTGEPEYALAGILVLGDAYIALHDDIIAAPPPRKLNETQTEVYKQQVAERAAVLRDKAYRFYDEGVSFAVRVQWHGGITERMTRRRDALAPSAGS